MSMNKTFLTGVDTTHEWMLKWWYKRLVAKNPDIHVTICDFGMSPRVQAWAKTHADCFLEYPKHHKCAWFYKTQAMLDSKYEYTCWMDVDCEVLRPVTDLFNYVQDGKIGLTVDVIREAHKWPGQWWATGLNVIKGYSDLLNDWHSIAKKAKVRGDQEALHQLITNNPNRSNEIVKIPLEYQWLRLQLQKGEDSPNKRVVHWTGPVGKKHIKERLMNEDDFNFNT